MSELIEQPELSMVMAKTKGWRVLGTSLTISSMSLFRSALGFVVKTVQAAVFGTGIAMDAYFGASAVPGVISGLTPSILASVFLPALGKVQQNDESARRKTVSAVLGLNIFLAAFFLTLGLLVSRPLLIFLVPHLTGDLLDRAVVSCQMLWATLSLSLLFGVLRTLYLSDRRFIRVEVVQVLPLLFLLICTVTFWRALGIESMALGMLLGSILQVALLLPGLRGKVKLRELIQIVHPANRILVQQIPWTVLSRLPDIMFQPIAVYWAAKQVPGAVSYLGYSQSLTTLITVVLGYGVSVVTFPDMVETAAIGEKDAVFASVKVYLRNVFLMAAVCAGLLAAFRVPLLKIVFQRGAFDSASVDGIARVLPWYLIGAVVFSCHNILRNLYYALDDFASLARLGIGATILYFVLAGFFGARLSYEGIAMAYAIVSVLFLLAGMTAVRGKKYGLWSGDLLRFMLGVTAAVVGTVTVAGILTAWLSPHLGGWLSLGFGLVSAIVVLFFLLRSTGSVSQAAAVMHRLTVALLRR